MHIPYFYETNMNARAVGMGLNEGKWYVLWHVHHDIWLRAALVDLERGPVGGFTQISYPKSAQTQVAQMHIAYFYEMNINARAVGMDLNEGKWYVLWHVYHDD